MDEADVAKLRGILEKELQLLTQDIHAAKEETRDLLIKEAGELVRLIDALRTGHLRFQ